MFLSKKNAIYFNKPKQLDPSRSKRVLGGWQQDEQEKQDKIDYGKKQQVKSVPHFNQNLLEGEDFESLTQETVQQPIAKQTKQIYYLDWDELDAKNDIEFEKKLVEDIVQPGGIRIKPSEAQLTQFFKQSKGMEPHIVGSLLLSKIQVNYPFQIKAKALYTIDYMVKKNQKYAAYFKAQSDKLKQFPEPEDNVQNYKKILKQTLNTIGINAPVTDNVQNEPQLTFVDPGYNDQPLKKPSDMKTFISQNAKKQKKTENKRPIIGPKQTKKETKNTNQDILGLDLLGNSNKDQGPHQQHNITFDDLLGSQQNYGKNTTKPASNDLI